MSPRGKGGVVKQYVQCRLSAEDVALVDAFAEELSRGSYGAEFSRAEALRIAAVQFLQHRQPAKEQTSAKQGSVGQRILQYLHAHGPAKSQAIAAGIGAKPGTVSAQVARMVSSGVLVNIDGEYRCKED